MRFLTKKTSTQWLKIAQFLISVNFFVHYTICKVLHLWLSLGVTASEGKAALPLQHAAVADPIIYLITLTVDFFSNVKVLCFDMWQHYDSVIKFYFLTFKEKTLTMLCTVFLQ